MTASRVFYSTYDSPLGELLLVGDGRSLTGLYMQAQKYAREVQPEWKRDAQPFHAAVEQLDAYFAGELRAFDLSLAPSGTDFQRTVWRALLDVQFGTTTTYGELARRIGSPRRAARGRTRERSQPDRHHRAVPSRHRRERQSHGLRRRHRAQTLAARARSTMELRTDADRYYRSRQFPRCNS